MKACSPVVLYGNSMFLTGIKAVLKRCTSLELITVEVGCPDVAARIDRCNSRVALFDLTEEFQGFAFALLRERPGMLLIGVDPRCDEVLLLSSQPIQAISMSDLVEVINKKVSIADGTNNAQISLPIAVDNQP